MKKVIDDKHPRMKTTIDGKIVSKPRPVCRTKTGFHNCCNRQKRKSDLEEYGVGSVLYFQFLKYMAMLFGFMVLLSIPSMLFFYSGSSLGGTNIQAIIRATSLGNLGSSKPVCNREAFILNSDGNYEADLSLSCPFGVMEYVRILGSLSSTETGPVCQEYYEATKDVKKLEEYDPGYYPGQCHIDNFE